VDYLSRGLDGAGSLHAVPPTTISRRWQGPADRATAAEFGRRIGAGLVVYGQLLPIGQDSVRLVASVVDARRGAVIAEARSAELGERVDRAADSVLVDILLQVASTRRSLGTRSLPAIKAFLRGEQHFRERSLDSAVASFRQAVELDTMFSLALHRLVSTYQWRGDPDVELGRRFSLQAGRFNHGLSARDSLLVAADSIAAAIDDTLLDSIARSSLVRRRSQTLWTATQAYPNDPEAWYQIGEARVHYGSEVGSTMARAMEAFDRSISLDSSFAVAYEHPISYTLYRGDCERALAYLRTAASMHVPGVTDAGLTALVLGRMLGGAAGWHAEIQPMLDTLSGPALKELAFKVRNCPDTGETHIWLLQQLAERRPGRGALRDAAEAQVELAGGLMNRGHLAQSYRVLRRQPIAGFLPHHIFLQLALLGGVSKDTAAALFRRWLNSPDLANMAHATQWWAAQRDTSSIKAMISRAEAKARVANREFRDNDSEGARIARVYLALARADTAEVWRRLAHVGGWQDENVLRSRLYAAQGKDSAAADVIEWEGWEGARNVLQRLLQAQIMERLDRPDEALRSYQFVLDMWRRADPELSTYVAEARAGVQRLGGETAQ
jgi:eukaryotic-like serine/threonine-protein kinase